jgi:hypothetical protein
MRQLSQFNCNLYNEKSGGSGMPLALYPACLEIWGLHGIPILAFTRRGTLSMASVFVRRSPAPPRVWDMLMDYWQVPASLAVTWWRALGRSHHARALAVHQAVLLFDAAPVAEAYHLVYGVCAPQAVIEVLEALVDEGQLPRSQVTAIEEAVLRNVDREGEWR